MNICQRHIISMEVKNNGIEHSSDRYIFLYDSFIFLLFWFSAVWYFSFFFLRNLPWSRLYDYYCKLLLSSSCTEMSTESWKLYELHTRKEKKKWSNDEIEQFYSIWLQWMERPENLSGHCRSHSPLPSTLKFKWQFKAWVCSVLINVGILTSIFCLFVFVGTISRLNLNFLNNIRIFSAKKNSFYSSNAFVRKIYLMVWKRKTCDDGVFLTLSIATFPENSPFWNRSGWFISTGFTDPTTKPALIWKYALTKQSILTS